MKPMPVVYLWGYLAAIDDTAWTTEYANQYVRYILSHIAYKWKPFNSWNGWIYGGTDPMTLEVNWLISVLRRLDVGETVDYMNNLIAVQTPMKLTLQKWNMITIPLEWLSIALINLGRGFRTLDWMNGTFLDDLRQSTVNLKLRSPWLVI